jgi:hypothetical protein
MLLSAVVGCLITFGVMYYINKTTEKQKCQTSLTQADLDEYKMLLDSLIVYQYNWIKSIKAPDYSSKDEMADSIFLFGNELLKQFDYYNKYSELSSEYVKQFGDYFHTYLTTNFGYPLKSNNPELLKLRIKLLQSYALSELFRYYCIIHYPVNMFSLTVLDNPVKKGKESTISITTEYHYSLSMYEDLPLLIVENDTLHVNLRQGSRFFYKARFDKPGTYLIPAKYVFRQWDHIETYETNFRVEVE